MFSIWRSYLVLMCMCVMQVGVASVIAAPVYAASQEIAAVVNDGAISQHDVNKRMTLIMASSGLQNNKGIRERLTPQVVDTLINEQIMLQEARKKGIVVEQAEIEKGFAAIAQQNKKDPEKFKSMLVKSGIDISTMYTQIESQIAWGKLVQKELRPKVTISDRDVDDTLERIKSKIGTQEYLAAEIYIPVPDPKKASQAQQLANRLVGEIRAGKASFFKLAREFSGAAGSETGGDLGWIQDSQMSDEFLDALKKVKKNQVTSPIKTPTGVSYFVFARHAYRDRGDVALT